MCAHLCACMSCVYISLWACVTNSFLQKAKLKCLNCLRCLPPLSSWTLDILLCFSDSNHLPPGIRESEVFISPGACPCLLQLLPWDSSHSPIPMWALSYVMWKPFFWVVYRQVRILQTSSTLFPSEEIGNWAASSQPDYTMWEREWDRGHQKHHKVSYSLFFFFWMR